MNIGGLQKVSLIDYPGRVGAVVFTQGCNFSCSYCHNPELVDPKRFSALIPEESVLSYLAMRSGKLEALTITGGEPTIQNNLLPFIASVKEMGYAVKLDTNGSRPDVLMNLLKKGMLDYLAMDIKAPLRKYPTVTSTPQSGRNIRKSVQLIMSSGLDYEFRTTIVKSQLTERDILSIGRFIRRADRYALQRFSNAKLLEPELRNETSFNPDELLSLKRKLEKNVAHVIIR